MEQYITEYQYIYIIMCKIFICKIYFIYNNPCTFYFLFTGKSNLMDAISFVLGEKTSNLRVKRLSVSNMVITKVNHCCSLQTHHFEN